MRGEKSGLLKAKIVYVIKLIDLRYASRSLLKESQAVELILRGLDLSLSVLTRAIQKAVYEIADSLVSH